MNLPLGPFKEYPLNDDHHNANSNEDNDKNLKIKFSQRIINLYLLK